VTGGGGKNRERRSKKHNWQKVKNTGTRKRRQESNREGRGDRKGPETKQGGWCKLARSKRKRQKGSGSCKRGGGGGGGAVRRGSTGKDISSLGKKKQGTKSTTRRDTIFGWGNGWLCKSLRKTTPGNDYFSEHKAEQGEGCFSANEEKKNFKLPRSAYGEKKNRRAC